MYPYRIRIKRFFSNSRIQKNIISSHFIKINDTKIHYVKTGHGPRTLLLMPNDLGSGEYNFYHQLLNFNSKQFTLIAWDPPGYGLSRPPARIFHDCYRKDADYAAKMMNELNYNKYSVLGWNSGSITAFILAANHGQKAVEKLVVWSAASYVSDLDRKKISKFRFTFDNLNKHAIEINEKMYGAKEFRKMSYDMFTYFCSLNDICSKDLPKITCPTLILHGDKDEMISSEHPEYNLKKIPNSVLYRFPEGKHNIHVQFVNEFNSVVQEFLKTK